MSDIRITSITIENFKGISKPVTVPLRPITLLFGKNSAGKSTILQAMLYALELIRTGNADIDKVQLGGDAIHLGGFRNLVHKHETERAIRLRFDFQLGQFGLESFPLYDELLSDYYDDLEDDALGNAKTAYVELEVSTSSRKPEISRYTAGVEGVPIASIIKYGKSYAVDAIEGLAFETRFDDDLLIHTAKLAMLTDEDSINSTFDSLRESEEFKNIDIDFATMSQVDNLRDYPLKNQTSCIPKSNIPLEFEEDKLCEYSEDEDDFFSKSLALFFSRCLVRPVEILKKQLEEIRYIGPIRDMPPRNHEAPITSDQSRWANGLAAWDALYSAKKIAESEQFTLEKVNEYIRDILQLGYELRRDDIIEVDANHELFDLLDNLDEGQASLFQNRYSAFREYMLNLPKTQRLSLYDLSKEVDVAPSDIGVGISQVVPVVVGALAKTAENKLPSILSIEQPELHIHPAVQCALGDLFIREKSDNRLFLIETHSEHLILRFLRRISETTDNEIKDPSLSLRPDELGVIYVNTVDNELTLTELPVDDDGEFTTRWPEGFFEERATELFGESDA